MPEPKPLNGHETIILIKSTNADNPDIYVAMLGNTLVGIVSRPSSSEFNFSTERPLTADQLIQVGLLMQQIEE